MQLSVSMKPDKCHSNKHEHADTHTYSNLILENGHKLHTFSNLILVIPFIFTNDSSENSTKK